jgi:hypothetical protein
MVLGIPFGSVLDYFLNYVVLSQTLKRFLKINTFDEKDFIKDKRKTYGVFATILGLVIDWVYIELVWDVDIVGRGAWRAQMSMPLQLLIIIVPIVMLFAVNFALSRAYLKLNKRQSAIVGISMAVFTAPWLLVIYPYVAKLAR